MTRVPAHIRRLLVVAPHPDDEAVAAWALIRQVRARGGRVEVLVVSDGGASHPNSRRWPRARLVAERRRETRRVLRSVGVMPDGIRFLHLPDSALAADRPLLHRRLAQAVAGRRRPELLVQPMPDDAHADHRAVAGALAAVPRRGECRIGYRVWPEGAGRTLVGPAVRLSLAEIAGKRAALRRYRTQCGLIGDAEAGFAMTHRHLRAFAAPTEQFAWLA